MKHLADILDELHRWSQGKAPDGFVFPWILDTPETMASGREVVELGYPDLPEYVDELEPKHVADGILEPDAAETLAIVILIQGYHFFREFGHEGEDSPSRDFKQLMRTYKLIKPLWHQLDTDPGGKDRARPKKHLAEMRKRLKPIISRRLDENRRRKENQQKKRKRNAARDAGGPPISVESDASSFPMSIDTTFELTYDEEIENALFDTDPGLSKELLLEGELPMPVRPTEDLIEVVGTGGGVATLSQHQMDAIRPQKNGLARWGWMAVAVLALVAAASLYPTVFRSRGVSLAVYSDALPVQHVIRLRDQQEGLIIMVDDNWDSLTPDERTAGLKEVYELAVDKEGVSSVIIQDARGQKVATADGTGFHLH